MFGVKGVAGEPALILISGLGVWCLGFRDREILLWVWSEDPDSGLGFWGLG